MLVGPLAYVERRDFLAFPVVGSSVNLISFRF